MVLRSGPPFKICYLHPPVLSRDVGGGEFTENIEKMGGEGTAEFIYQAIKIYCDR